MDPIARAVVDSIEACSDITETIVLSDMQKLNVAKSATRSAAVLLRSGKIQMGKEEEYEGMNEGVIGGAVGRRFNGLLWR